jgi:hypothetical protein
MTNSTEGNLVPKVSYKFHWIFHETFFFLEKHVKETTNLTKFFNFNANNGCT